MYDQLTLCWTACHVCSCMSASFSSHSKNLPQPPIQTPLKRVSSILSSVTAFYCLHKPWYYCKALHVSWVSARQEITSLPLVILSKPAIFSEKGKQHRIKCHKFNFILNAKKSTGVISEQMD